jgi:RND family efflux transporter MFP subunit
MQTMEKRRSWVPIVIVAGTIFILVFGGALFIHARNQTNNVALVSSPKGVTAVEARPASFRPSRRYVGTVEPWVQARIGPQLVSGYVDTVLVRPGASVKRGQVLATLDCRTTSAASHSLSLQARALETTQAAIARESARIQGLLDGGFASADEAEQKQAESQSKQAQLLSLQAQLSGTALQVSDCVLRAPFDGEVAERLLDPGAFARPGSAIVTVVDRSLLRVTADVPEDDFEAVSPGTPLRLHLLATGKDLSTTITRRAPAADSVIRTVHFEADLQDAERRIPVGTTTEITLEFGEAQSVTEIPLAAASVKGTKATVFVVSDNVAHAKTVAMKGEREGKVYVETALPPGSWVITEGRSSILEGDRVKAKHADRAPDAALKTSSSTVNAKEVE